MTLKRVREDYARRKDLAATGAISNEELAHARDELAAAEAAVAGSRETVERNRALVDDTVIATQPDVQAAAAQLRQAFLNNARAGIVAPVSGYVARRSVQVGQRVQPGNALMAVVPTEQMWVEANFKETQLRHMRLGQEVELKSDLYAGDVKYKGRIQSLAWAPARRSRCCRRRTPVATGSRSCSACRCASPSMPSSWPNTRCASACR